jgi:CubicO group peptidase (beta-lactamase class C family)
MLLRTSLLLLCLALILAACSPPPDPAVAEALTSGVWHGYVAEPPPPRTDYLIGGDFLYQIELQDGSWGGRSHMVIDGKQITEVPITGLTLDGSSLEIQQGSWAYRGEVDLEAGTIEGGLPDQGIYETLPLTRVDAGQWPMLQLRTVEPTPGEWTRAPEQTGDGWPTAAPAEVGIDPDAIESSLDGLLEGEAGSLHSFLVVRDGHLVMEQYFHGWGRDDPHDLASCTKSVSSLLIGIAIDRGLLAGVETPLLDFFPTYAEQAGQGWQELRLVHLLTMTMGLDWTSGERYLPLPGVDRIADILSRNRIVKPGTKWRYVDRNMSLLAGILLEVTATEADRFADEHLFSPLGFSGWSWDERRQGRYTDMIGSLALCPRDMAKLGQLVLDRGLWQGRRVVSEAWLDESTRTFIETNNPNFSYGYLWWRVKTPHGSATMAMGTGDQKILVYHDMDMVIVTTGGNQFNGRQHALFDVIDLYLAPGIERSHS